MISLCHRATAASGSSWRKHPPSQSSGLFASSPQIPVLLESAELAMAKWTASLS